MKKKYIIWIFAFIILIGMSLYFGAYSLRFPLDQMMRQQLVMERLPRVMAALLTGAMLGCGGVVLRKYTQNDLADPGLMGIASGSQLFLVVTLVFFPHLPYLYQQVAAILGSGLLLGILFLFQHKAQKQMVLFGFALSAFISSMVTMIATTKQLNTYLTQWSSSGLQLVSWQHVMLLFLAFILGLPLLYFLQRPLDIYATHSEMAHVLGVDMKVFQAQIILFLALYIGVATSIVGNVIFFGLMIATLTKKESIISSLYVGAMVMILSDLVARVWSAPEETSFVAVIAVIASPYFFYLVRKQVF